MLLEHNAPIQGGLSAKTWSDLELKAVIPMYYSSDTGGTFHAMILTIASDISGSSVPGKDFP